MIPAHTHNPILQGIQLSNQLEALKNLQSAARMADPTGEDRVLDPIRATLAEQVARVQAEFDALVNLYGGPHAC